MGTIVAEVDQGHLVKHPKERVLLQPLLENFDVTWARRRRAFGSELSVYFLKPARHMEKAFGFEAEILAIYSGYSELQPRTVQAIEQFLSDEPARGRVDTMVTFLISEAANSSANGPKISRRGLYAPYFLANYTNGTCSTIACLSTVTTSFSDGKN